VKKNYRIVAILSGGRMVSADCTYFEAIARKIVYAADYPGCIITIVPLRAKAGGSQTRKVQVETGGAGSGPDGIHHPQVKPHPRPAPSLFGLRSWTGL
jgi:hypothetical protein